MWQPVLIFYLFNVFLQLIKANHSIKETEFLKHNAIKLDSYVYWPNGTVPFHIEENHFDSDQKAAIETTLAVMGQKTCLKFLPALSPPTPHQHVLVFTNPGGVRKCVLNTDGHPRDAPHRVILGYSCLKSPHIEMVIMKALGFGFEHNRASRDLFIDVQLQNIDMAFVSLFTKDIKLPPELQALPYDFNSVTHFGERDYSKNGHRTIIIKDHKIKQNRVGLSPLDLRKIEIVYGPECRKRNRQEKIELCQTYPGIARKKRELEPEHKSLRVNPDITPPPEILHPNTEEVNKTSNIELVLEELGIVNEVQQVVDQVYKVSSLAFKNARLKYCNGSKPSLRASTGLEIKKNSDILGVIAMVANFAKSMVDSAVANLTTFCMESGTVDNYQRVRCDLFGPKPSNCITQYKSTKSGPVKYSTQHRPLIRQSTKHDGKGIKYLYGGHYRSRNDSEENVTDVAKDQNVDLTTQVLRRKRAVSFEMFRNKRHVQSDHNNKTDTNVSLVEDTNTAVNSSKGNLRSMTVLYPVDGRRQFKAHRYSVKHKNVRSAERYWDNSKLSTESRDKVTVGSNESEQRKEGEYGEDVDGQVVTKVKNYKDVRYEKSDRDTISAKKRDDKKRLSRVDKEERLEGKKYVTKYREKRGRENNENTSDESRHVKKYRERPSIDKIEESLEEETESKKYKKGRVRLNREENVEDIRYVKKIRDRQEREKKNRHSKENGHVKYHAERPGSDNDEESSEERREINKYNKRPNRQKSPQKLRLPQGSAQSSVDTRLEPRTVRLTKLNREFYNERRWPGGVVPYYIKEDPNYDTEAVRRRLEEVNNILLQSTCVRLHELDERQLSLHEDYLILDTSADFITGRVGGKQNFGCLELFRGGQHRQHAAMVVMAMLGFYFELSRHDRDKYVRVHLRHVRPDKLHHFEKIREDATLALPYDYESATHPAWQFWRRLGRSGISAVATYKHLDPDGSVMKSLGQHEQLLSDLDIVKINSVYGTECFRQRRDQSNEHQSRRMA